MTPEQIQQRLVDSVRYAMFDELKEVRLSREDAKRLIKGSSWSLLVHLRAASLHALDEYISYCEAVEIK